MYTLRDKLPASVEADEYPKRLSEIERQRKKIEWLEQLREDRKINEGESDGENNEGSSIL